MDRPQPFPARIIDDAGAGFSIGLIGGTALHFLKGIYNSPKGTRFISGTQAVMMKAPRTGGALALWSVGVGVFDCAMIYARQKEDPLNRIFAASAIGGLFDMRHGLRPAMAGSVFSGGVYALLEGGFFIMTNDRFQGAQQQPLRPLQYDVASSPPRVCGLLGGK